MSLKPSKLPCFSPGTLVKANCPRWTCSAWSTDSKRYDTIGRRISPEEIGLVLDTFNAVDQPAEFDDPIYFALVLFGDKKEVIYIRMLKHVQK